MIELVWDQPFLRLFKKWQKRHPDLVETFRKKLSLFTHEPYHPSLRTHRLTGQLQAYWAFSITYEYRVVFEFLAENRVLLIDIGTHDEVY